LNWFSQLIAEVKLLFLLWQSYRSGKAAEAAEVRDQGQQAEIKVDNAILAARKDTDGTVDGAVDAMQRGKF
jgi:hypothetical protein